LWPGHSVEVLLRTCAKCLDGQEEVALRRITAALTEADDAAPEAPAPAAAEEAAPKSDN